MTAPLTVADIVAELREMLEVSRRHPTIGKRLFDQRLTVRYEILPPDGGPDDEPTPYLLTAGRDSGGVEPADPPYDEVDIVLRATPDTLHRVTSGELGGREAIASGLLDIRKAPSMPKMLLMRSLFNSYKKARTRGQEAGPSPAGPSPAGPSPAGPER